MKVLKSIFILILFSTFITSCTSEDIVVQPEVNSIENLQATGSDDKEVDETEKGD